MTEYFGALNISEMMTESLMMEIMQKYHFQDAKDEMHQVFLAMRSVIKDQERYEIRLDSDVMKADIAVTLGGLVDHYQEQLSKSGDIMKELMVEQISWDLLAQGYKLIRDDLCEKHGLVMAKMHFWGGEQEYPLEKLQEVLEEFEHVNLQLSHALSLKPSKSAVFQAELRPVEDGAESHGFCSTCNRQESCEYYHD